MKKTSIGLLGMLALIFAVASAFTTSKSTATLVNCTTQTGNIDSECPYDPLIDCCFLTPDATVPPLYVEQTNPQGGPVIKTFHNSSEFVVVKGERIPQ
jgi:hypothetical protein